MSNTQVTHVGFSDESNWKTGRFRSLGLVTTSLDHLEELKRELKNLLSKSQVSEFKWKELGGANERSAAEKMIGFAIDKASAGKLRIDVLIWDTWDSRHNVPGRDDIANLQRMYYHLFRNVLRLRWPSNSVWRLHPDEHTAMDWQTVEDYIESAGCRLNVERSLFGVRLQREFGFQEIVPVRSADHLLLQLADLFCGMAVFSRQKFDEYEKWLETTSNQVRLFGDTPDVSPSGRSKERFQVLKTFDKSCKECRLGVSLKEKRGLWTPKPENPINFWLYEPQHPEDKAPTKNQQ